jgi:hypothetical protein
VPPAQHSSSLLLLPPSPPSTGPTARSSPAVEPAPPPPHRTSLPPPAEASTIGDLTRASHRRCPENPNLDSSLSSPPSTTDERDGGTPAATSCRPHGPSSPTLFRRASRIRLGPLSQTTPVQTHSGQLPGAAHDLKCIRIFVSSERRGSDRLSRENYRDLYSVAETKHACTR